MVGINKKKWWKQAIIYEIFPRSFKDSNNDGIGDLRGIISKLDYLKSLHIDAIWLCPIYPSPNIDGGYDVEDYYDINSEIGTMSDIEQLIEKAHLLEIKIILDLVANHTSDRHYWFQESKSSKDSKFRDYYIWRKGKSDASKPNNWISSKTGNSVWSQTEETDEYYLHLYTENQPDLNWENKNVRNEIYNIMKFWFDKGVDGFRMDVINKIAKAPGLPDIKREESKYFYAEKYFENQPHIHQYLKEMYDMVLAKYSDRVAIGQTSGISPEEALLYTDINGKELNLFLQFEHVDCDRGVEGRKLDFDSNVFKKSIYKWQTALEGKLWNTIFFGNHDLPRMVSHFGNDKLYRKESATMLATIQLLLKGTQIIYMGDEIGMTNANYDNIDDYTDNRSKAIYRKRVNENKENKERVFIDIKELARDNARYPMQWNGFINGGFSTKKPWIKVNKNHKYINVKNAEGDKNSILAYYKNLILFRKKEEVIAYGSFVPLFEKDNDIFAYKRVYEGTELTVIANMSSNEKYIDLSKFGKCILHNYPKIGRVFRPYEARVFKKNIVLSISELLLKFNEKKILNAKKIKFLGVEGYDVYNITAPFSWNGKRYLAGRVEMRNSIYSKACFFEEINESTYKLSESLPSYDLQDPFITKIHGNYIFGGVEIFPHPCKEGRVSWRTKFYKGSTLKSLEFFIYGPKGMKDIRFVQLKSNKIGIFTRPQGEKGGRGKIGFTIIENLEEITEESINKAPLLEQFFESEWGGVNEVILLENGKLGVLGHIARFTDNFMRHYYPMVFVFDPETMEYSPMEIIARRNDFLSGPAKREDLVDVLFSGGLVRLQNKKALLYTGVSDAEAQFIEINDPFLKYERE